MQPRRPIHKEATCNESTNQPARYSFLSANCLGRHIVSSPFETVPCLATHCSVTPTRNRTSVADKMTNGLGYRYQSHIAHCS